jgi:hypothetical protein
MNFIQRNRTIILWSILLAMPVSTVGFALMKLAYPHGGFVGLFGWLLTLPFSLGHFLLAKLFAVPKSIFWEVGFVFEACGIFLAFRAIAALRRRMTKRTREPKPVGMARYVVFAAVLLVFNFFAGRELEGLAADFEDFPDVPTKFVPGQIKQAKNDLLPDGKIDFVQMAFARGKLYVASMIGVIEIEGTTVSAIYRWHKHVPRIDNVWAGPGRSSLWIMHRMNDALTLLDDAGWHNMELPVPKDGYYSRGDMMHGFRSAATDTGFWMAGGPYLWSWEGKPAAWVQVPLPAIDNRGIVFGLHSGHKRPVVAQGEDSFFDECKGVVLLQRAPDRSWAEVRLSETCVKDLTGSDTVSYFRNKKGDLFRFQNGKEEKLEAPGKVVAMTMASESSLLAAIEDAGIFRFDGKWTKLFDYPFAKDIGEQFIKLAAHDGRIALATSRSSHMKPGRSDQWVETGADALWVSDGERLVKIEVPD